MSKRFVPGKALERPLGALSCILLAVSILTVSGCGSTAKASLNVNYGPSWGRFYAHFPESPRLLALSELTAQGALMAEAYVVNVAPSQVRSWLSSYHPLLPPKPDAFLVVVIRERAAITGLRLVELSRLLPSWKTVTIDHYPGALGVGLENKIGGHATDALATEAVLIVAVNTTLYELVAVSRSSNTSNEFERSFSIPGGSALT
jgi:hypothetical protein